MKLESQGCELEDERQCASYLIRIWLEPREGQGDDRPLRGYIRHLRTGQELYFTDSEAVIVYLLGQLEGDGADGQLRVGEAPQG